VDINNEFYVSHKKDVGIFPQIVPVIKTKQQGYRFVAWILATIVVLPDKEGEEEVTLEDYIEAVRSGQ
jgi:hypothetical protein